MFEKRKIFKRAKDAEEVELRFERWSRGPRYKIRILRDGKYEDLGITTISSSEEKGGKKTYSPFFGIYAGNVGERQRINFGSKDSLEEAKLLAYRKTLELAQEIANKNRVRLEDRVDDDEIIDQIEYPWKYTSITIFTLSIIVGLALSISSLSTTGYAVSNALGSGQGIGGILLFVVGLVGMFFSLRK